MLDLADVLFDLLLHLLTLVLLKLGDGGQTVGQDELGRVLQAQVFAFQQLKVVVVVLTLLVLRRAVVNRFYLKALQLLYLLVLTLAFDLRGGKLLFELLYLTLLLVYDESGLSLFGA